MHGEEEEEAAAAAAAEAAASVMCMHCNADRDAMRGAAPVRRGWGTTVSLVCRHTTYISTNIHTYIHTHIHTYIHSRIFRSCSTLHIGRRAGGEWAVAMPHTHVCRYAPKEKHPDPYGYASHACGRRRYWKVLPRRPSLASVAS